jgi:predicted nuclease of predicted toxin-antitoxin system
VTRLKLDENLGHRGAELLNAAGFDVATVYEQGLASATDEALVEVCRREHRCLVTLDLDFGNPFRFNPDDYAGIAVLRLPSRASNEHLLLLVRTLAEHLAHEMIDGRLWIVEIGRVRMFEQNEGSPD